MAKNFYATGVTVDGRYYSVGELNGKEIGGGVTPEKEEEIIDTYIASSVGDLVNPEEARVAMDAYFKNQKGKTEDWLTIIDGYEGNLELSAYMALADIAFVPDSTIYIYDFSGAYASYDTMFQDNTNLMSIGKIKVNTIKPTMFNGCTNLSVIEKISPTKNTTFLVEDFDTFRFIGTDTNITKIGEIDLNEWLTKNPTIFNGGGIFDMQKCQYCLIKGFGDTRIPSYTGWFYSWTPGDGTYAWGTGNDENRQSLVDTFLTYSVDRSSNPMNLYQGIIPEVIYNRFTDEEKAALTAKGYIWQQV